jgi:hypothetical protein
MKFFLQLTSSSYESTQKAALKIIRTLNEHDFGKEEFDKAEGSKVLSEVLSDILQGTI